VAVTVDPVVASVTVDEVLTGAVVVVDRVVAAVGAVTRGTVTAVPPSSRAPARLAGPVFTLTRGVSRCEPVGSAPPETTLAAAGLAEPLLSAAGADATPTPSAGPAGLPNDPAGLVDDAELPCEGVSAWATPGALANKIPAPAIAAPAPTQPTTDDAVSIPRLRLVTNSPVRSLGIGLGTDARVVNEVPHRSGRSVSQASDELGGDCFCQGE
jgi:hypothetical protein